MDGPYGDQPITLALLAPNAASLRVSRQDRENMKTEEKLMEYNNKLLFYPDRSSPSLLSHSASSFYHLSPSFPFPNCLLHLLHAKSYLSPFHNLFE